ncbi:hypothetical protein ACFQX9_27450 [Bradyrhizobium sp. GCM10028915]|uniref:hypothetical protein n=1 Tax=Bradyrhizobium sp. GCM10028915 TaxID=3273385 RepID=UPI00361F19D1
MSDAYTERQRLYRSSRFRSQVADRLELDGCLVVPAIAAFVEADLIPARLSRNDRALAVDGATILAAIGGRQSRGASIVRTGLTLCAMTMQHEAGTPKRLGVADIYPSSASVSFGTDIAEVFLNLSRAAHGSSTKGFKGVSIGVHWTDEQGSILFGTIEQGSEGRKRTYASQAFPAPPHGGKWDSCRCGP